MARDAKGHFLPGNTEGHRFTRGGHAADAARKATEAREQNRTVAEVLRTALAEKASSGSPMTKLEYLASKAIQTHATDEITFKDLRDLQKILGEDIKEISINGEGGGSITITLASPKAVAGLQRAIESGAQPAAPEGE